MEIGGLTRRGPLPYGLGNSITRITEVSTADAITGQHIIDDCFEALIIYRYGWIGTNIRGSYGFLGITTVDALCSHSITMVVIIVSVKVVHCLKDCFSNQCSYDTGFDKRLVPDSDWQEDTQEVVAALPVLWVSSSNYFLHSYWYYCIAGQSG